MAGNTKTTRADLEAERSAMWARLAGVNAELEEPVSDVETFRDALSLVLGQPLTTDEAEVWCRDVCVSVNGFNFLKAAYLRLYRVASPIKDGLRRECDHVTYGGTTDAADDLRDELAAAEIAMGDFLNADCEDEGGAGHD